MKQSEVRGVTGGHLGRAEHGEQAASKGMLEKLAVAHRLRLTTPSNSWRIIYLKAVAEQINAEKNKPSLRWQPGWGWIILADKRAALDVNLRTNGTPLYRLR